MLLLELLRLEVGLVRLLWLLELVLWLYVLKVFLPEVRGCWECLRGVTGSEGDAAAVFGEGIYMGLNGCWDWRWQ